jgi:chromosome segregation ATPase
MEFEQIVKRLEWLDTEQRKTKTSLTAMEERLASIEATSNAVLKQIKDLSKEISQASSAAARVDKFNELLAKQRQDINKLLDGMEKKHLQRESEAANQYQLELAGIRKEFGDFRDVANATEIKKELKARATEQARMNDVINQLKPKLDEALQAHEEMKSSRRLNEENRRQDVKRVNDLQGELTALRKRIDETRAKTDVNADGLRNADNRIGEILASEAERKSSQAAFLAQHGLAQVEQERAFKEWRDKFDDFKTQVASFYTQMAAIDETLRAAQKAQETFGDLNSKLERRINEVSEMQRLTEDRLRQEWVTFKGDDQKRWTGFTLSQEESLREVRKDLDRIGTLVTTLDDLSQTLQDQMQQSTDTTEKQLQEMMNSMHEWMTAYQRIMGRGKKTARKSIR